MKTGGRLVLILAGLVLMALHLDRGAVLTAGHS
jgi:hypothetical protein